MQHTEGTRAGERQPGAERVAAPGEGGAFADNRPDAIAQRKLADAIAQSPRAAAQREVGANVHNSPRMAAQREQSDSMPGASAPPNRTGLPDTLKSGVESLSGMSLDHVKVHYNSSKPAQLQALAYAQGSDIHLGPGRERHLPHEAWHVVQQAQGRVKPTVQMKQGVAVNDDAGLEHEADVMGARAVQLYQLRYQAGPLKSGPATAGRVVQRLVGFEFETAWDLQAPDALDWDSDTVLVRGTGWQLSPDEVDDNQAKIEFKTDPFDVDGNPQAVAAPIAAMFTSMNNYIQQRLLTLPGGQYSPLASQIPAAHGVQVQPQGALAAKPQVTGGVRTDLVLSFLKDMASDEGDTDLMPGDAKKATLGSVIDRVGPDVDERSKTSREYWGVVTLLANLVRRFQADKTSAVAEYTEWRQALGEDYERQFNEWVARVHPNEERQEAKKEQVKAAIREEARAKREEIRARLAPSYAKARASALPRIAFNDLPQVAQGNLLRDVLRAADLAPGDSVLRMFPLGMKDDEDHQETIAEWIESIQEARGADEEGELWSARSLGTGPVGPVATRGTGIPFELRGFAGGLPHNQWPTFATPFIVYFSELNKRQR